MDPKNTTDASAQDGAATAEEPAGSAAAMDAERLQKLQRRAVWAVIVSILVYAGFALYADVSQLAGNLRTYAWWTFLAALALSGVNYWLRAIRWRFYLDRLQIEVPETDSNLVFVAGMAFSVTPGKVGELIKAFLLKRDFGIGLTRTTPVVVGERLADFLALCTLLLVGLFTYQFHTTALIVVVALVVAGTAVLASPRFSAPIFGMLRKIERLKSLVDRLEEMAESMAALLKPRPLAVSMVLSVVSWGAECVGLYLILYGLGADTATVQLATFIYAATTLLGAVSMIPGGLGVTEASMVSAILLFGALEQESSAVAATLLTRIATLWFAVGLGFIALAWYQRRQQRGAPAVAGDSG